MRVNKRILFHILLVGLFTYQLFWISIGAYFSFPNAEDLSVTVLARDKGVFHGAIHVLQTFDGRYTVNILHGLNPLAFDAYYANRLVAIFTICVSWLSVYLLLNIRFKNKPKSENLIYALGFTTLFFSTLDLSQSLYWMICSFVYIYPLILFLNFYTFFLRYKDKQKNLDYALSVVFLFLAVGCCELYLPLFGIFLIALLFQHKNDLMIRKVIIWFIVIYIASSLFFITSPGIIYRFNIVENDRAKNFIKLINPIFEYLIISVKNLNFIPFFLFVFLFNLEYNIKRKKQSNSFILITSLTLLLSIWILVLLLMGDKGYPSRILPVIIAILTFTFIKLSPGFSYLLQPIKKCLGIVLILLLVFLPNSYTYIQQEYQSGKLDRFKKEMDQQYILLTNKRKLSNDCIETVTLNNLELIIPNSIATKPYVKANREDDFWNIAYETYFKIDEVRLDKDTCKSIISRTYEILY